MRNFTTYIKNLYGGSRIGRRLIAYVLVFSTIITLITSMINFELDYQKEMKGINLQFNQIEVSYIKSIETAVWRLDHEQINTLLKGMLNLQDMVHIDIVKDGALISQSFGVMPKSGISREFSLSFQQNQRKTDLGMLRVTASNEGITKRLHEDLWANLVQNSVIIFSVAIFIFFFVQESITKHLANISGYAKRIDQSQDLEALALSKNNYLPNGKDELDDVVGSINEMRANLRTGYQALIASEDRLKAFAEAASDWLWEMRGDLKYSYVSDRFFEITGLTPSQVIGRSQTEIYTNTEDNLDWLEHQKTLAAHRPYRDFTLSLSNPNGDVLWLRLSGRPIFDSTNQFQGYRGTGTDITNEVRAREEAIETTLRFLDAIENVSDGIAFWDSNDCFVLCNRIFRSQAGKASDQLVRGTPYENYMRALLATGTIEISVGEQDDWLQKRLNERKRQIDPVEVYRDGKWLLIRDGRASDGSTVSVTTNITEVKQREQQLQQVTDAVPILLAYVDENYCYQMINKEYELCFNLSRHNIIGTKIDETVSEIVFEQLKPHIDKVLNGTFVRFQIKLSNTADSLVDGPSFSHLDASYTPNIDQRGHVSGFFIAAIDVSDLVLAEEMARTGEQALGEQTQILRASIEAMAQGISIWDEDKKLVIWNETFEAFMRLPKGYLYQGLVLNQAIKQASLGEGMGAGSEIALAFDEMLNSFDNDQPVTTNISYNDGQILAGQSYETATGGSIFMLTDVTEQTRAQEQLHHTNKIDAIGQLTGGVAHDFNNLLAIIIGSLNLLDGHFDDAKSQKLVSSALRASRRGADLTQRLLAFGRRQALMTEHTNANELVESLSEILTRTLGNGVEVKSKLGSDLWSMDVDRGQLENALLNLAINARDAMPMGGKLAIETANILLGQDYATKHRDVEPGAFVMISVADDGFGMSHQVARQAIEPFFTTKKEGTGSGLGLSMIHGFANQSGGHLRLYSEPGHGTVARIYLPALQEGIKQSDPVSPHTSFLSKGEHILVIEDDIDVRDTTTHILTDLGYIVTEAANSSEAMNAVENTPSFDLVFSDVFLEGSENGPAIVKKIRSVCPEIKILFTSGYTADQLDGSDFQESNMMFISKPFEINELSKKIREIFDDNQPLAN